MQYAKCKMNYPAAFGWQRRGEQSEDKGTDKPDGPEFHNHLINAGGGPHRLLKVSAHPSRKIVESG